MEKVKYTEYHEIIKPEEEQIEVIVQVPDDPEDPVRFKIMPAGWKTFKEWAAINQVIREALRDAGWTGQDD